MAQHFQEDKTKGITKKKKLTDTEDEERKLPAKIFSSSRDHLPGAYFSEVPKLFGSISVPQVPL